MLETLILFGEMKNRKNKKEKKNFLKTLNYLFRNYLISKKLTKNIFEATSSYRINLFS